MVQRTIFHAQLSVVLQVSEDKFKSQSGFIISSVLIHNPLWKHLWGQWLAHFIDQYFITKEHKNISNVEHDTFYYFRRNISSFINLHWFMTFAKLCSYWHFTQCPNCYGIMNDLHDKRSWLLHHVVVVRCDTHTQLNCCYK